MKKLISFFAVLGLLWACQEKETQGGDDNGNTQQTSSVTVGSEQLSAVSVVLNGKMNLGTTVAADLKIGFQYSRSAGIIPANSTTVYAVDADSRYNFSTYISGLEPSTTYYYRSFVRQNDQDTYGETKSFTTKDLVTLLETMEASEIGETGATLSARLDLTDIRYNTVEYGFYCGDSETALNMDVKCEEIKDHIISALLTDLSPTTQYWFQAYLKLDDQSLLGKAKSFKTDKPHFNKFLTFISEGETSLSLTNREGNAPKLYYSFDKKNWQTWDYSALTFTGREPLYLCGDNPQGVNTRDSWSLFVANGSNFEILGDIMSLIDKEQDLTSVPPWCFAPLFSECTSLTKAPELPATTLASDCYNSMFYGCTGLTAAPALPATTLAEECYAQMFYGCTGLTAAPALPATTLARSCYGSMFSGCTGLTAAPALPATTLASSCYGYMFSGCTGLTAAPALPATTLASSCYRFMFYGCTGLTASPALPATTLANGCYEGMFSKCTSLNSAPALPATTLARNCYNDMFYGCTGLTAAPALPATTLAERCYERMFWGCTNLNYVKCLATDISPENCTNRWLVGVSSTGVFIKAPGMINWKRDDYGGIPTGWEIKNDNSGDSDLSANKYLTFISKGITTLSFSDSYENLPVLYYSFDKTNWKTWDYSNLTFTSSQPLYLCGDNPHGICKVGATYCNFIVDGSKYEVSGDIMSLIDKEHDSTIIPSDWCFAGLFGGSKGLLSAPELPATQLMPGCYVSMFSGCTSLTAAPALPATTLADSCYYNMFCRCTSLTAAPALPSKTLAKACYDQMFAQCTNLMAAPTLPAEKLVEECYMNMFYECSKLRYVKCLATDISAKLCVGGWLQRVANSGTFVKSPEMNDWPSGDSGIPTGWTVVTD